MGIRFRCPHCIRPLNVKAAQAGQQGICPKCHEKILVPSESELDPDGNELSASISMPSLEVLREPAQQPEPSTPDSASAVPDDFLCGKPGTAVHQIAGDPIFEAPNRIWHIRDAQMTESGPFKGKRLRRMIDSGKLKANDYVCREDWQDWRVAGETFPELGATLSQIPLASDSVFTDSNYEISGAMTAKARKAKQKHRLNLIQIVLCASGLLIMAALCYLLIRLI